MARVLKCRPEIEAKRKDQVKIHSIIRAEFTNEREDLEDFRMKIKANVGEENAKQKSKFSKLK